MSYSKSHKNNDKPKKLDLGALKNPQRALSSMQRLCSMREYCHNDIATKLKKYDLTAKESEQIIASLEQDKFLDNSRYAAAFVRDKAAFNGWGPAKIKWALKSKKVEEEIIMLAMQQLPQEDEAERLLLLLNKKMKTLTREQDKAKVKVKLMRFAISRGFDYDKVITGVNKIMANFVTD